ncbi:MAG TPA: preprotein translocase subunit SecE [Candidatus Hydrogenedentes bacterium]|nr:preprotein translocase subunit SecE [Candidatus Hydrogenedentota bacterium]HPU98369.1 preprotein translocase subunit SecE [Candidatus Hydrogenedentota bacterium]
MAKAGVVEHSETPGLIQRIRAFFDDVMVELKKVTWPTRDDLLASTKVTLVLIAILAVLIFLYDQILGWVILQILQISTWL